MHGAYVPEDIEWTRVGGSPHHHQVWLRRRKPGHVRRTRILIGEVRRHRLSGRYTREWRAFAEGTPEFPPVFENHFQAMAYLKERWEAGSAVPEAVLPRRVLTGE